MRHGLRLVVAILLGLFAGIIAIAYIAQKRSEYEKGQTLVDVLCAKTLIKAGTTISADIFEKRRVPSAYIQPSALRRPEEAMDQVTIVAIAPGEQIQASKLAASLMKPLNEVIPRGMRAVTMAIDNVRGLSGLVQVDDTIDLIGIYQLQKGQGALITTVRVIFQNVHVLAVGQFTIPNVIGRTKKLFEAAGETTPGGGGGTLTLAMTPFDAQRLILAQDLGKITVIMHAKGDAGQQLQFEAVTSEDLLGNQYPVWTPATRDYNLLNGGRQK